MPSARNSQEGPTTNPELFDEKTPDVAVVRESLERSSVSDRATTRKQPRVHLSLLYRECQAITGRSSRDAAQAQHNGEASRSSDRAHQVLRCCRVLPTGGPELVYVGAAALEPLIRPGKEQGLPLR
jgi:hypothetical protein